MREIKFRAWDLKRGCEVFVDQIIFDITGAFKDVKILYPNKKREMSFEWRRDGEDLILREFTGLKDKNGKEIYEGDVLQVVALQCKVQWDLVKARWYLKELNGSFDEAFTISKARNYEIIGNIYSNPELITP